MTQFFCGCHKGIPPIHPFTPRSMQSGHTVGEARLFRQVQNACFGAQNPCRTPSIEQVMSIMSRPQAIALDDWPVDLGYTLW